jgi:hypothetical protein
MGLLCRACCDAFQGTTRLYSLIEQRHITRIMNAELDVEVVYLRIDRFI